MDTLTTPQAYRIFFSQCAVHAPAVFTVQSCLYQHLAGVKDNLYEADIMLTDDDKRHVDQREEGDADGPRDGDVITKRNAIRNRQKLWRTRVIPYRISPALCKY